MAQEPSAQGEVQADSWPGDRVPAANDAELAYKSLDPQSIRIFKQAMLSDVQARERQQFLKPTHIESLQQLASQQDNVRVVEMQILTYLC